jgi:hypothetical protein
MTPSTKLNRPKPIGNVPASSPVDHPTCLQPDAPPTPADVPLALTWAQLVDFSSKRRAEGPAGGGGQVRATTAEHREAKIEAIGAGLKFRSEVAKAGAMIPRRSTADPERAAAGTAPNRVRQRTG